LFTVAAIGTRGNQVANCEGVGREKEGTGSPTCAPLRKIRYQFHGYVPALLNAAGVLCQFWFVKLCGYFFSAIKGASRSWDILAEILRIWASVRMDSTGAEKNRSGVVKLAL
jgi:hypothetical protein